MKSGVPYLELPDFSRQNATIGTEIGTRIHAYQSPASASTTRGFFLAGDKPFRSLSIGFRPNQACQISSRKSGVRLPRSLSGLKSVSYFCAKIGANGLEVVKMGKISVDLDVGKETTIRRYMSFKNFERLINSRSMYFSRFDSFDDHLEGGINKRNFSSISNTLEILDSLNLSRPGIHPRNEQELVYIQKIQNEIQNHIFPSLFGAQKKVDGEAYLQRISSWLYASCWTDLPHECHAMWQLYGSSGSNCRHDAGCTECAKTLGDSVCIETTIGSVEDSLVVKDRYNLSIRKIEYINHRESVFEDSDMVYRPFFSKALHFSYENEIRFMLWPNRKDIIFSYKFDQSTTNNIHSEQLEITNLESFIDKIILSPIPYSEAKDIRARHMERYQSTLGLEEALSNSILKNKVRSLLNDKNLKINIVDSDLNQICVTDSYTSQTS